MGIFIGGNFLVGNFSGGNFLVGNFSGGNFLGGNFDEADKNKLLDEVSESDNIVTRPNEE